MIRLFGFGGPATGPSPGPANAPALQPEQLALAMVSSVVDPMLAVDAEDQVFCANSAAAELVARLPEQVTGKPLLSLFARADRDRIRSLQRLAREGAAQRCEARLVGKKGDERLVVVTFGALRLSETALGTVLALRDVTEERRAHDDLARSEARYRHLFEGASDAIMTFDSLGRFTTVNDAGEVISGYRRDDLIGRFFGPLLPLTELPRAVLEFKRALAGSVGQFETMLIRKDGGRRFITVTYSCPQRSKEVLCLIRDATEEKQLQQQLIQSEKMAAIGQLVSGVAHELNNPLASIAAFAQLLLVDSGLADEERHSAEVIIGEARRAARIVHNLLTFARQHKSEKSHADINKVLEDTLELRAYELNVRGIRLHRDFQDEPPHTMVDVYQLQQVILNLVTNAEQAMVDVERPHHRLTVRSRTLREVVRIEIEDTGPGIPPESLERIFNPFYTTKPVGQGTGLGLSISLGIISEHGGRIWAENVPNAGCRFCIELPRVEPIEAGAPASAAAAAKPRAGLRVLVADDELPLRTALSKFFRKTGHSVVTVGSGREAMERAAAEPFDVILLDMRMPDISGHHVFDQWRAESPELTQKVVFLTGDIVSADLQRFLRGTGRPYLSKPFEFDAILQLLPQRAAAS
ncbi:MAG: PAS domain S-box protein [Gemmatimonadota bacterium]|nr:PAS domain S-box protein [Gemmatimonadota bacterium]